jgi:hypothetical protein
MYFAGGAWRDAREQPVADPPALATATSTSGPIVDLEGHVETTGHTIRDSQGTGSPFPGDAGAGDEPTPSMRRQAPEAGSVHVAELGTVKED